MTVCFLAAPLTSAHAYKSPGPSGSSQTTTPQRIKTSFGCGSAGGGQGPAIYTSIDFGCNGDACVNTNSASSYCASSHSPIIDIIFAIIRFLSFGVGLIIVMSLVIAGIQYITSSGNPEATAKAISRIRATVIALILFIFAFAILNYLIPAGFFSQ